MRQDTKLEGVKIIEPLVITDERGYIVKPFVYTDLPCDFKQAYYAYSHKGVRRGMCYCQADKLVYCSKGKVLDVVLDLKTGKYLTQILSEENHLAIFIPAGYAHGYEALTESIFNYLQTRVWNPEEEKKAELKPIYFEHDFKNR
jgi:dTDP-4-dehydrorhamnose 3,5-epimerase